jgi:hypothetical protein
MRKNAEIFLDAPLPLRYNTILLMKPPVVGGDSVSRGCLERRIMGIERHRDMREPAMARRNAHVRPAPDRHDGAAHRDLASQGAHERSKQPLRYVRYFMSVLQQDDHRQ